MDAVHTIPINFKMGTKFALALEARCLVPHPNHHVTCPDTIRAQEEPPRGTREKTNHRPPPTQARTIEATCSHMTLLSSGSTHNPLYLRRRARCLRSSGLMRTKCTQGSQASIKTPMSPSFRSRQLSVAKTPGSRLECSQASTTTLIPTSISDRRSQALCLHLSWPLPTTMRPPPAISEFPTFPGTFP